MPRYGRVKTFEEEEALLELIEGLRANNGWLYRGLVKKLSRDGNPKLRTKFLRCNSRGDESHLGKCIPGLGPIL
jgi:hypothetical protein